MRSYWCQSQIRVLIQPPDLLESIILPLLPSQKKKNNPSRGQGFVPAQNRYVSQLSKSFTEIGIKYFPLFEIIQPKLASSVTIDEVGQAHLFKLNYFSILATEYKGYLFRAHKQAEKLQQSHGKGIFWEQQQFGYASILKVCTSKFLYYYNQDVQS